jgi:hypothetical protein
MKKEQKRKSANFQILSQAENRSLLITGKTQAQSRNQSALSLPPNSQFVSPLVLKSPEIGNFTVVQLKQILKDNNVKFDPKARKAQLLNLYNAWLYA